MYRPKTIVLQKLALDVPMIELSTRRLNGILVFTSVSEKLNPRLVGIPVYLPILLKVATGFSNNLGGEAFSSWMNDLNRIGAAFKEREIKPCPGKYNQEHLDGRCCTSGSKSAGTP